VDGLSAPCFCLFFASADLFFSVEGRENDTRLSLHFLTMGFLRVITGQCLLRFRLRYGEYAAGPFLVPNFEGIHLTAGVA